MLKTRVPVREPHVRQFVVARFGNNTTTINLSKKSMLGSLTELACEKVGFRHALPKTTIDDSIAITLIYPNSLKNHFIHPRKVDVFSKLLAYLFNQAFLEGIETAISVGISDYQAVDMFMDRYGITEEMISSDTLRKKWRDHQRGMTKKTERMLQAAA
ncbi:hypothetical protein [Spirosoma sp.]|uniref:hypothetical protein n=1 Tax=Spirosoma sp. TaxID=1899569 RepID=UPI00261B458D|nr:hypothetical protein [Spirosoma sp.]MCX6216378.1 hypothetical protein [Spirosoma sp.]